jgi:transcriptional regulator with XRE-family HTH domain
MPTDRTNPDLVSLKAWLCLLAEAWRQAGVRDQDVAAVLGLTRSQLSRGRRVDMRSHGLQVEQLGALLQLFGLDLLWFLEKLRSPIQGDLYRAAVRAGAEGLREGVPGLLEREVATLKLALQFRCQGRIAQLPRDLGWSNAARSDRLAKIFRGKQNF